MRVLMFGWEFPPHIAGGLGTACYGMQGHDQSAILHIHLCKPRFLEKVSEVPSW